MEKKTKSIFQKDIKDLKLNSIIGIILAVAVVAVLIFSYAAMKGRGIKLAVEGVKESSASVGNNSCLSSCLKQCSNQNKCSDGTPYNQCSKVTTYKYCQDGTLFNSCQKCGCPAGQACQMDKSNSNYGSCVVQK